MIRGLSRRARLSPSVITVEVGGAPGGLCLVLAAYAAVRRPHEAKPLLAAWLRPQGPPCLLLRRCGASWDLSSVWPRGVDTRRK
ncbi:hypothetical protein PR202_ga02464 [Eleusine coracana subsp. coracana]|uniref:Uncharacterized protein n=1 Tax=Eleusine coracana subsp. coracana TaxID=191504 RepID=A0AAV5BJU4_ELECO|nr:hypothetical protein PR202_ga02464 [Eleusine coracana subsp. coracana]